jgi:OPA family glycerol-3-phosphate transporter-like MFS transporter
LKPAPHIARLPAEQVDAAYTKYRYRNFLGIFIGYACYYLLRGNFTLVMPYLIGLGFSKPQLGWVLSALPISYGISKFAMGNLSDRCNPRYFIIVGLVVAVIINFIFGLVTGAKVTIIVMYILMLINGLAQGMGAPPCYRTVAHWYPISKRGVVMGLWNTSHNVGAALLGGLGLLIIPMFGWKSIFYVPPILVSVLAIVVVILMRDTPQSVGLMPVEEYSKEYPENQVKNAEVELSGKEILFKYVLVNKYVWFLAVANAFVYFVRYGVVSWAPLYLIEVKGMERAHSGMSFVVYELAGILGMLLCGYASDKWFKGKRAPVSIICMIIVFVGVLVYWQSPSIVVAHIALFLIGMFIYGPVMLVGVQIMDIMPKKAVGTAVGLLGFFGYCGGNLVASLGFGYIVDYFGWTGGFMALVVSCILATVFFSLTLSIKSLQKKGKKT